MCVRSGFYNSPPRSIEVHLLKFEKWNDGATEEIDELPSRKVDASLPFYSFQWDVAYCLSMAPHKLRLWKLLRGDEGRFARVHNGYGLIEDSLKSAKMADLLAPGESSMNLLIEKRNVNDRWVWSGEDYKAQPSPQPGHVSGERVSLPSPPHQTFDDSDEDLKKAIEMSLKTAQEEAKGKEKDEDEATTEEDTEIQTVDWDDDSIYLSSGEATMFVRGYGAVTEDLYEEDDEPLGHYSDAGSDEEGTEH